MATVENALALFNSGSSFNSNTFFNSLSLTNINTEIQLTVNNFKELEKSVEDYGKKAADCFANVKKIAKGIAAPFKQAASWIQDSLELTNTQNNAETQLKTVLNNAGAPTGSFELIKQTASNIQGSSLYGDEEMLGGAATLATHVGDAKAIQSMMGTLSNYAAGMSGGGEVDYNTMVDYASQLGQAMDGNYDALLEKGFELSAAQKQIIENGTDMQKALVIDDVINQSWDNLSENMANTPQGMIIQLKNAFTNIREEVGARLYPAITTFLETLKENMPQIETALTMVAGILGGIAQAASNVASAIIDNWSLVLPILGGIVAGLIAYNIALLAVNISQGISAALSAADAFQKNVSAAATFMQSGATFKAAAAQYGFNAALLACPLTWIIVAIIAVIAAIYLVVAAINKVTGSTYSATGIIFGAIAVLAAAIINVVIGLINALIQFIWTYFVEPFIGIIEWILNVTQGGFDSFGDGVKNLLGNIISWFLSLGKVVTKIIDAIFGTDWTSGLNSLQDKVSGWGKNENAITLDRDAPTIDARLNYGETYNKYYDKGANLFNSDDPLSTADDPFSTTDDPYNTDGLGAYELESGIEGIYSNTGDTAESTAEMANSMSASEEELKLMREIAERQAIDQFTTAQITLNMTNYNDIASDVDLDGIIQEIEVRAEDAIVAVSEGAHA